MNAVAALVRANLLRLVHERSNVFFIVVLPLMIVFALGMAMGGAGTTRVGVVDPSPTAESEAVLAQVRGADNLEVEVYDDAATLRHDVARQALDAGWVVEHGDPTEYRFVNGGTGEAMDARTVLVTAVQEQALQAGSLRVLVDGGADPAAAEEALERATSLVPEVAVTVDSVNSSGDRPSLGTSIVAVQAAGQLSLFVFLTCLNGSAYLLLTRQLGVTRRMRAGPVPVSAIVAGEGLSRFLVAILQGLIVFFGSILLFGIDWRAPWTVLLLTVGMGVVGTGAAMLLGTLARSEQQVGAIAIMGSLVLAAIGGSMMPLEFFPDWLRTVGLATPHGWMNEALWRILVDGAGLAQVWPNVVGLFVAGAALLVVASVTLARTLR